MFLTHDLEMMKLRDNPKLIELLKRVVVHQRGRLEGESGDLIKLIEFDRMRPVVVVTCGGMTFCAPACDVARILESLETSCGDREAEIRLLDDDPVQAFINASESDICEALKSGQDDPS